MEHGSLSKSKDAKGREKGGMLAVDIEFLTTCMKHVIGGSIVVDINEVANDAGYKNPHSVSNRLTQMKDRYGLKISGSTKVRSESQLDNSEIDEFKEALAIASPENPAIKTGVGRKHSAKGETGRKSATKKKTQSKSYHSDMASKPSILAEFPPDIPADNNNSVKRSTKAAFTTGFQQSQATANVRQDSIEFPDMSFAPPAKRVKKE